MSKSMYQMYAALIGAMIWVVCAGVVCAENNKPEESGKNGGKEKKAHLKEVAPEKAGDIQLKDLGSGLYKLGKLTINAKKRTIKCSGKVNMDKGGPIELLACTPEGKRHETVFVMNARPFHLQIALLLLDVTPGYNAAVKNIPESVRAKKKPADTVKIDVRWKTKKKDGDKEKWMERPAGQFLYNVKRKKPMKDVRWAFIGSKWVKGVFKADQTGSTVVTFRDLFGVLELASEEVNSDTWFDANKEAIPPVDTPVQLIIRAQSGKQNGEKENSTE